MSTAKGVGDPNELNLLLRDALNVYDSGSKKVAQVWARYVKEEAAAKCSIKYLEHRNVALVKSASAILQSDTAFSLQAIALVQASFSLNELQHAATSLNTLSACLPSIRSGGVAFPLHPSLMVCAFPILLSLLPEEKPTLPSSSASSSAAPPSSSAAAAAAAGAATSSLIDLENQIRYALEGVNTFERKMEDDIKIKRSYIDLLIFYNTCWERYVNSFVERTDAPSQVLLTQATSSASSALPTS